MPRVAIQEMLKKRKMSRYRLALLLEMDQKNVARLFKAGYDPRFSTLIRVARALKCRVKDLIKE